MAGGDDWLERKVLNEIMSHLVSTNFDRTVPEIAHECHRAAEKVLGLQDAYEEERRQNNQQMLALEEKLSDLVAKEKDKLIAGAKLAAVGNIFDDILTPSRNLELIFQVALSGEFAASDYEDFKGDLEEAQNILYILDNSGEIVADKIFINQFPEGKEVTLVVRKSPILTKATEEDVKMVGMENLSIIDPGVDILGLPLEHTSVEFKEKFESADLVIAKGTDNFETLRSSEKCYFLLRTQDGLTASKLGVKVDDLVFIRE